MKLDYDIIDYDQRKSFRWWMNYIPFFKELRTSPIFIRLYQLFPNFGYFKSLKKAAIHIVLSLSAISFLMFLGLLMVPREYIDDRFALLTEALTFSVALVYYLYICSRVILQLAVSVTATTSLIRKKMPKEIMQPVFVTPMDSKLIFNSLALTSYVLVIEIIEEILVVTVAALIPVSILFIPYCIHNGAYDSLIGMGSIVMYTVFCLIPLGVVTYLIVNVAALAAITIPPVFVNLVVMMILLVFLIFGFILVGFSNSIFNDFAGLFNPLGITFWITWYVYRIFGSIINRLGMMRIEQLRHRA